MENFLIVGITISFLLCLLVLSKKEKDRPDLIFGFWQINLIVHFVFLYIRYSGLHWSYPHFLALDTTFGLLHAPLLFLYIQAQVGESSIRKLHYLLHAAPFLTINAILVFTFYFLTAEQKINIYQNALADPRISITDVLMTFQGVIYFVWSLSLIRRYEIRIKERYSSIKKVNLRWLKKLLIMLGLVVAINLTINLLFYMDIFSISLLGRLNVIIFSFLLLVLGYYGISRTTEFRGIEIANNEKTERYEKSGLSKEDAKTQITQIKNYMHSEKPYLKSDLSLMQLAELIGISTNHLSQAINQTEGKSFYEFVNEYRAEEVKSRLRDDKYKHYKILAIAYDSGFSSKSVFNSFFKKVTNTTPTAFREK